jgi:threonine dehydrogenase-like Zn-dependent dehydrogenase
MRALVFDQSLSFQADHPEPKPSDGDTLLRVRRAGVCSTDLEITKGYMGFRGILGHEFVADVIDSPDASLKGKRVAGEINVVCGKCDLCAAGLPNHCRHRSVLGILNHDGAFADYVRLPAANLHVIPDAVSDDEAVFVEPLAAAFQVLKQIRLAPEDVVTVLGDGRLGLLVAQVLHSAGCPVRVIGKHAEKLALCEKWSIAANQLDHVHPHYDQDVVVDCTGSAAGFELAMHLVRPRGTIVLKSTVAAGKSLNLAPLVIDEITVIGSRCGPFPDAIRALEKKSVDVASMISQRMRIEDGVDAMNVATRSDVVKVLLTFD